MLLHPKRWDLKTAKEIPGPKPYPFATHLALLKHLRPKSVMAFFGISVYFWGPDYRAAMQDA